MKTIVNKTHRPLKISLARGRALRLGPRKEGQIATNDAERESVQKLVASGDVEVYDDSSPLAGGCWSGFHRPVESSGTSRCEVLGRQRRRSLTRGRSILLRILETARRGSRSAVGSAPARSVSRSEN